MQMWELDPISAQTTKWGLRLLPKMKYNASVVKVGLAPEKSQVIT